MGKQLLRVTVERARSFVSMKTVLVARVMAGTLTWIEPKCGKWGAGRELLDPGQTGLRATARFSSFLSVACCVAELSSVAAVSVFLFVR